jgi:hypothetical protein
LYRWVWLILLEYWPTKYFYLPLIPQWFFLGIKTRSATFFTNINPLMEMSGMFGASKSHILEAIPAYYKPVTLKVSVQKCNLSHIQQLMLDHQLKYPIILKPDIGERGKQVEKIVSDAMLEAYLLVNKDDLILQEFVQAAIELGVFYIRLPNQDRGIVSSVTLREFMSVQGNGQDTIQQLMLQNARMRFQLTNTQNKLGEAFMQQVLPEGELKLLEPIGNHCRGTKFVDANYLINNTLHEVFDKIAKQIDGFYFGRFDLKVDSYEDLYAGKTIKILELNGTNSEPGHVYDPDNSLWQAYRDMYWHWYKMAEISIQNRKRGLAPKGFWEVVASLRQAFSQ